MPAEPDRLAHRRVVSRLTVVVSSLLRTFSGGADGRTSTASRAGDVACSPHPERRLLPRESAGLGRCDDGSRRRALGSIGHPPTGRGMASLGDAGRWTIAALRRRVGRRAARVSPDRARSILEARVLVVDDEREIRDVLTDYLRSEEHTSELQSHSDIVCRLLLEKKKSPARPAAGVAVLRSLKCSWLW